MQEKALVSVWEKVVKGKEVQYSRREKKNQH